MLIEVRGKMLDIHTATQEELDDACRWLREESIRWNKISFRARLVCLVFLVISVVAALFSGCTYDGQDGICPGGFCVYPADAGQANNDDEDSSIPVDSNHDAGVEDSDAGSDQGSEDADSAAEDEDSASDSDDTSSDDSSSESCCKHHKEGHHKCKHGKGRSWRGRCWR